MASKLARHTSRSLAGLRSFWPTSGHWCRAWAATSGTSCRCEGMLNATNLRLGVRRPLENVCILDSFLE